MFCSCHQQPPNLLQIFTIAREHTPLLQAVSEYEATTTCPGPRSCRPCLTSASHLESSVLLAAPVGPQDPLCLNTAEWNRISQARRLGPQDRPKRLIRIRIWPTRWKANLFPIKLEHSKLSTNDMYKSQKDCRPLRKQRGV